MPMLLLFFYVLPHYQHFPFYARNFVQKKVERKAFIAEVFYIEINPERYLLLLVEQQNGR